MESHGVGLRRVMVLAFCVAGIWSAYIYQGFFQETVVNKDVWSEQGEVWTLGFPNLAQSVVCLICSFIMIKILSSGNSGGALWWSYWSAGMTNTIGPAMVPEYVCTLLLAGGVSMFAPLKTSSKTISKLAHPNAPIGYGLCFLNLTFDGFTNATQDSIKANAIGQNFIFLTISRFGFLTNTTITKMRKFVSIVVSSVLSSNPLSTKQWTSVIMVFSGLPYQIYLKWRKLQRMPKKKSI
ncbi:unnamed protein product [Withania somnifera]